MSGPKKAYESFYGGVKEPSELPWHREQIPPLLEKAANTLPAGARVVDLGCGTGVFSVYLAQRGYQVTALDFVAKALEFTRERAARHQVTLDPVQADVTTWEPPQAFDLVLDSGCLHGLTGELRRKYKARLLRFLKPGAPYVLIHFTRRNFLDWSPIGPRRIPRKDIEAFLGPELTLREYLEETAPKAPPSLLGTRAKVGHYLFSS